MFWVLVPLFLFAACNRSEQARKTRKQKLKRVTELHKENPLPQERLLVKLGEAAPDFHGPDSSGTKFSLADYRGKVTLVYYWAHW